MRWVSDVCAPLQRSPVRSIRSVVSGALSHSNSLPAGSSALAPLRDARETARLGPYLRDVYRRRRYVAYVATSEMRSRQMDSVLGNLWHLLNPILQIGVYWVIFGLVLNTSRGVENFVAFLSIGIFTYQYSQRSAMAGARSVRKNYGLMTIISFPRALLPATSTTVEALAALPAFGVMFVVALATGEPVRWTWVLVLPTLAAFTLFNFGLSMSTARATNDVADIQQLLPFVFRLGFYASGVLFNVESYVEQPKFQALFEVNPLYCFIELNRTFILGGDLSPYVPLSAGLWTVALLLGGFFWFRAGEDSFGE